ncbi:BA75_01067T0 [Komagataella pastoris]|uniref:AP complex subunit beta n=1 Tax=Komagataella pastoris TaxID=4922 RepID=A0A1B2J9Q5_PICPA|nr:BA75_01067T0 [Komagataella pastoris]
MSKLEKRLRNLFSSPRKGETFELKSGLASNYAMERKESIRRVIAAMTVGKDVSSLFPDVLKNIATHDLEQKKLVYLYLMNYAKTNPELSILAVNTFVKDSEDPNPLIRALSIRTMGCIRVDKMVDYMATPLRKTLMDTNPYVRKTAAICVAKLFELHSDSCIEQGFLERLVELVDDSNPMVVANAISSLVEISRFSNDPSVLNLSPVVLKKLLMTLNECTEWGRITILTCLADFETTNSEDAFHIMERCSPQLQHENPAVVLAAVKVLIKNVDQIDGEAKLTLLAKLSSPLVSLLSTPPEIQYVGLKNIKVILEKYPTILSRELRAFFCKYSDPLYLKLEKIEILIRLVNDSNATLLLSELKEYALEFDQQFVDRAIQAIGQIAIKLPSISKKAVDILYDIVATRPEYVINEAIVVLQEFLRRYPVEFTSSIIPIIADLSIQDFNNSKAISSYIWIIGEYTSKIPHLESKLQRVAESFLEAEPSVQLVSLTTVCKCHLFKPTAQTQQVLQKVLEHATQKVDNSDVRDKAFIYWRLLSLEQEHIQKEVILTTLPKLDTIIPLFPTSVLNELVNEISMLSTVYEKPGRDFVNTDDANRYFNPNIQSRRIEELQLMAKREIMDNTVKAEHLLDFDDGIEEDGLSGPNSIGINELNELNDLFSGFNVSPSPIE